MHVFLLNYFIFTDYPHCWPEFFLNQRWKLPSFPAFNRTIVPSNSHYTSYCSTHLFLYQSNCRMMMRFKTYMQTHTRVLTNAYTYYWTDRQSMIWRSNWTLLKNNPKPFCVSSSNPWLELIACGRSIWNNSGSEVGWTRLAASASLFHAVFLPNKSNIWWQCLIASFLSHVLSLSLINKQGQVHAMLMCMGVLIYIHTPWFIH